MIEGVSTGTERRTPPGPIESYRSILRKSSGGVDASPTSLLVPLPEKAGPMHPAPRGGAAVAAARWHAPGIPCHLSAHQSDSCVKNA